MPSIYVGFMCTLIISIGTIYCTHTCIGLCSKYFIFIHSIIQQIFIGSLLFWAKH